MKSLIQIALPTGHTYEIESQVIAENRAKCMLELHPDEFADIDAAMADTVELFDDNYEVRDWALNQMNPDEYMPIARLVRFVPPEIDFQSGDWSYHDAPAMVGELDGDQTMRSPVEAVLAIMAQSGRICNVTVLNDSDNKPFAGVAMFRGGQAVVGAYANALGITTNMLTAKPDEVHTH